MISNLEKQNKIQHPFNRQGIRGKKVVIIGDMDGIGQVTAAHLVERGSKVFIAATSAHDLTAAFAAIAKTGGEWDGIVVDLSQPDEIKRFFNQAERRLGMIDAVINHFPDTFDSDHELESRKNFCVNEAIQRLQMDRVKSSGGGQIVNIGKSGSASISPVLRRQASDLGVRMTLITPGEPDRNSTSQSSTLMQAEDIAHCVCDILSQTFGMDMIFLKGQHQKQLLL